MTLRTTTLSLFFVAASLGCEGMPEPGTPGMEGELSAAQQSLRTTCPDPGPMDVTVWASDNYTGPCEVVPYGSYASMTEAKFNDGDMSSFKVGSAVRATFYTEPGFKTGTGAHRYTAQPGERRATMTSLGGVNFKNEVKSMRVFDRAMDCNSPPTGSATLFDHDNQTGDCFVIKWSHRKCGEDGSSAGVYETMAEVGLENDDTSSVKLGPNTKLTLCEDEYFFGECRQVVSFGSSVVANLGSFSNRTSSARVWFNDDLPRRLPTPVCPQ